MGLDSQHSAIVTEAKAELAFVTEFDRQEAMRTAEKELKALYGSEEISDDRRRDAYTYHILQRALRDADDVRTAFAGSVKELEKALVLPEANKIWSEYIQFCDEEFPDYVDPDTFEKLVAAAKKDSVSTLISTFGYEDVRRSMPGVLALLSR
jgi:hypothetical protein